MNRARPRFGAYFGSRKEKLKKSDVVTGEEDVQVAERDSAGSSPARRLVRTAVAWLVRAAVPRLHTHWLTRISGITLFAFGAFLSQMFLYQTLDKWIAIVLPTVILTGLYALIATRWTSPVARVSRAFAWICLFSFYGLWGYLAISFGLILGWATPLWVDISVPALIVASFWTTQPGRRRPGLPMSIPISVWTLACLLGWLSENGVIRCDDYLRFLTDDSTEIVILTTPAVDDCVPGEQLYIDRYPRRFLELLDGERYVFTTQRGREHLEYSAQGQYLDGSICSIQAGEAGRPQCTGTGTGQVIMESASLDRIFVGVYLLGDEMKGMLAELPRTGDVRVLRELRFTGNTGEGFYDPASETINLIADEGRWLFPVDARTFEKGVRIPAPLMAGETIYHPEANEGMFCTAGAIRTIDGGSYLGVAFRGSPFTYRALGSSNDYPWAWLGSNWGCDFDSTTRRTYSLIPSLSLLTVMDYDTGDVLEVKVLSRGHELRALTLDRSRGRMYVAGFFSGEVRALDIDTLHEVERWFAGRYVRHITMSHDGRWLFVTSNLGVVRILLDDGD